MLKIFKEEKALLTGHFLLSSGLHSPNYMQCALVLQKPWIAEKVCKALAKKFSKVKIDAVVGPAFGGILVSYELARALKVKSVFAERVDGSFALRRGFSLKKGDKVLVVEDVITTGKSIYEVIDLVEGMGVKVVGVASIVDRSDGAAIFSQDFHSMLKINIKTYRPEDCPLCKERKIPLVKPGSRALKALALFCLISISQMFLSATSFAETSKNSNDAAVAQAKTDYKSYLEQLKAISQQYQEVTGEIKKVIKDEGFPVWNEETGEITMEHDLDMPNPDNAGANIKQNNAELVVSTELPGLKKDSIRVSILDGKALRILGQKKANDEKVERLIQLPSLVQDKGQKAKYEDGVLVVTLKKSTSSPKEVVVPL